VRPIAERIQHALDQLDRERDLLCEISRFEIDNGLSQTIAGTSEYALRSFVRQVLK
jgi:hypothetical protein